MKKIEIAGLPSDIPVLRVVFEERVFFDTGSWEIRSEATTVLNLVAEELRKDPASIALFVAGHTDSRGSEEYNLDLSIKRANTVAEGLSRRSGGGTKIWRVGFGKAIPLRPNNSPENMAVNRRVEFIIASRSDAIALWLSKQGTFLCSEGGAAMPEFCKDTALSGTFSAEPVPKPDVVSTGVPEPVEINLVPFVPEPRDLPIKPPPV